MSVIVKKVKGLLFTGLVCFILIALASCQALADRRTAAQEARQADGRPIIYTSFYPIYDLVRTVAGDNFDVRVFVDTNKDPHFWEPTPRDMERLAEAELLIVNGANMERWLDRVKSALPDLEILDLSQSVELITYRGAAALGDFQYMAAVEAGPGVHSIEFGHTHEDLIRIAFYRDSEGKSTDELISLGKKIMEKKAKVVRQKEHIDVEDGEVYAVEMGHESGQVTLSFAETGRYVIIADRLSEALLPYVFVDGSTGRPFESDVLLEGSTSSLDKISYDPHSWLSLANMKKYANAIYDELSKRHLAQERLLRRRKVDLVDNLTSLEFEYRKKFSDLRIREFVVSHNAYAYLARDFELVQFPLQGLVSTESPSLKTIRVALDFCRTYEIDTVFYEYGREKKGVETIAAELSGRILPLASLEYVTDEQLKNGEGYVALMRMNLDHLYEAMQPRTEKGSS